MLYEINNVRQYDGEEFRRWFVDDYFDLIVWYDQEKNITGFQLCYDKMDMERSLTWRKNAGYSHSRIDDGEMPGHSKMTPILVTDGIFEKQYVADKFRDHSRNLDKNLSGFVYHRLLVAAL